MKTPLKTLTAAALATAFVAGFAMAQSADARDLTNTPSQTVNYADLNISTKDGATELLGRIHRAASRVCRSMYPTGNLNAAMERGECMTTAVEIAVHDVNAPTLTALYEGRDVQVATNK